MLCNKLTMYNTKCFIVYTIKYMKRAAEVRVSPREDEPECVSLSLQRI